MIEVAYPGLLAGGAAGAVIALLLHLLTRTPPTREPLPTARFLTKDARTLLRLRQRPTDVPLLLVRIAFIMTLAAGLAGLTWTGAHNGTARVILVDAGADTIVDWDARLAEVRRLAEGPASAGKGGQEGGQDTAEPVLLAYGLDTGYRVVDVASLERLVRGSSVASAQDGLRALRAIAADGPWERIEAVWLTRPAWRAWTPDLGLLRAEIWPGRAPLAGTSTTRSDPGSTVEPSPSADPSPGDIAAWIFPEAIGTPLEAALHALGVRPLTGAEAGSNPEWIVAHDVTTEAATALLDRAREGSSVVLSGRLPGGVDGLPWSAAALATSDAAETANPAGILLPWAMGPVGDGVTRLPGAPTDGASVVAVFEDALPAASSLTLGRGCVTYLAANVLDASLTESDGYPALVESLASGCAEVASGDTPLDDGAIFALERPDLPVAVDVATLGGHGTPLTRWLLVLALLFLLAEVGMTRRAASGKARP